MNFLMRHFWFILSVWFATHAANAGPASVSQTQTKLKQLENKMSSLTEKINVVHTKRDTIHQEMERIDKEIGNTIRQLTIIDLNIHENQQQINVLKQLIDTLNQQMHTQLTLLAKHIRSRYKMGEYQPMKWLLNQENPYAINRLLTYYRYVVNNRQKTIDQVRETEARLKQNQEKLNQETKKQQLLENQVKHHQAQLNQDKSYQTALILTLDKEIRNQQQTLNEYQHNKDNLTHLIENIAQQALTPRHYPLVHIRRHLQKPVNTPLQQIEKLNQGVAFFADEGTPVTAVYAGKVVFSDWLKGYGLLLIIDHGSGYMTLYAHNQSLFKQKGNFVEQGEKIATVGHTGGLRKNGLYFEVRHSGKAIPPLEWLS
jgi:septal ring factor EnvC (AmiA/AmiB activator)